MVQGHAGVPRGERLHLGGLVAVRRSRVGAEIQQRQLARRGVGGEELLHGEPLAVQRRQGQARRGRRVAEREDRVAVVAQALGQALADQLGIGLQALLDDKLDAVARPLVGPLRPPSGQKAA